MGLIDKQAAYQVVLKYIPRGRLTDAIRRDLDSIPAQRPVADKVLEDYMERLRRAEKDCEYWKRVADLYRDANEVIQHDMRKMRGMDVRRDDAEGIRGRDPKTQV